jgi:hypothetical protein
MKNIISIIVLGMVGVLGCNSEVTELEKVGPEVQQYVADAVKTADSEVECVNAAEWRNWYDYGFVGNEYTVEAFQYGSAYYQPLYFFGNHPLDIIDRIGY